MTENEVYQAFLQMVRSFGLEDHEVDLITKNTTISFFPKGTLLLQPGQVAKHCYMVLNGAVRAFYLKDGEEHSTAFYLEMEPVNSFTSFTQSTPSRHYLVCAEDCWLTVGDEKIEQKMCMLIPHLEHIIRKEVEIATGKAQDEHDLFIMSSPEERYLRLMKERKELLQRMPQHQIASYIGVTPESLSRIRKRLAVKV